MEVDANRVINMLLEQIKHMSKGIAVKDVMIESLQKEIVELKKVKEG